LKPKAIQREAEAYLTAMTKDIWEQAPPHFITSSTHSLGREEILEYIDDINNEYYKEQSS
jgi:GTP-binding protein